MKEKPRIGVIGLGKMGMPMAKNLLKAGFPTVVYDSKAELMKEINVLGAKLARSPEEVGDKAEIVLAMTPYTATREVILEGVSKGTSWEIIIDGGNSDPRVSQEIGKVLGAKFLDAGCSGGPQGAEEASLAIMVGGNRKAYERALPIFETLGIPEYVGPSGSGHLVKMLHNILAQIYMAGIGEVWNFAEKLGLDPWQTMRVLNKGLCQSRLLELCLTISKEEVEETLPYVGGGDYPKIGLEISNEVGASLPFTALTLEMRKMSRDKESRSFIIQALLRKKFGGHEVKAKPK